MDRFGYAVEKNKSTDKRRRCAICKWKGSKESTKEYHYFSSYRKMLFSADGRVETDTRLRKLTKTVAGMKRDQENRGHGLGS